MSAGIHTLNDSIDELTVNSSLRIFEDTSGELAADTVTSDSFTDNFSSDLKNHPHFGYTPSSYWYHFKIRSDTKDLWYLLIDFPLMRPVNLYIQPVGEKGRSATEIARINNRVPAYRLNLEHDKIYDIYLKIGAGKTQLHSPIKLMKVDTFMLHSRGQYTFFSIIFAALCVLGLYNLILFFNLRSSSYLSLVIFIFALQVMLYRESGIFPPLNFLNNPDNYFFAAPSLIVLASGLRFWRSFSSHKGKLMTFIYHWVPIASIIAIPFTGLIFHTHSVVATITIILSPIIIYILTKKKLNTDSYTFKNSAAIIAFILCVQPYLYNHSGLYLTDFPNSIYLANTGILLALLLLSINQAEYTRTLREQKERTEAISKTKDEFLTTMSHELRTPMSVILGSNTLLQKTQVNNEQLEYLDKQKTAATHMMEVVNQVLDLSSIENQATQTEHMPFQLAPIIEQLNAMFTEQAKSKGIEFRIHNTLSTTQWLEGDSTRLSQVLINLIGNSLKFTQHGFAELGISLVSQSEKNITISFVVQDSGPGIDNTQRHKVFEPFSQLDPSPSREQGGTGLGLAISYKLVKMMGGKLTLNRPSTTGSQFSFSLDFPRIKAREKIAHVEEITGSPHILLVDDDELSRFISQELLQEINLSVTSVDNGHQALAELQQRQFDLILMDISMPGMDGYETTQHIRQKLKFTELPIVALTAHAINGERDRCLRAGMDDYLAKPFEPQDLKNIIAKQLKNQRKINK